MAANNVTKKLDTLAQYVQEGITHGHLETIFAAAKDVQDCQKLLTILNAVVQQVGQEGVQQLQSEMAKENAATGEAMNIIASASGSVVKTAAVVATKEPPPSVAVSAEAAVAETVKTVPMMPPTKRLSTFFAEEDVEQSVVLSDSDDDDDDDDEERDDLMALRDWSVDNVSCFMTMLKLHLAVQGDDGHDANSVRRLQFSDDTNGCRMYIVGKLQRPSNKRACPYRTVVALMEKKRVTGGGQGEHINALRVMRTDFKPDKKSGTQSPYFEVTKMTPLTDGPMGEKIVEATADVYDFADVRSRADFEMLRRTAVTELKKMMMVDEEDDDARKGQVLLTSLRGGPTTTTTTDGRTRRCAPPEENDDDKW